MSESRQAIWMEDAEKAALGALMLSHAAAFEAATALRLRPDHFYAPAHRKIAEAVWAMAGEGRPVDTLTVKSRLVSAGEFEGVGGDLYLDDLVASIPAPAHAEYYLDLVRQKAVLRGIRDQAVELESAALTAERGDELLSTVGSRFAGIIEEAVKRRTLKDILADLRAKWRSEKLQGRGFAGLETPWGSVNEMTCGLGAGVYMLAARPSQGKTTVEDQLCEYVAEMGVGVARATLDMTVERLVARMAARRSGVSLPKLNAGFAGESQLAKVDEASGLLEKLPMWVTDELHDVGAICAWVRAMKLKHDIGLFTLDYVQQVEVHGREAQYMNENATLTHVSRRLKRLSLELGIPVVLLSQLTRGSDNDDRVPTLSDLRGSGSLEQDANVVILLYRDKKQPDSNGRRPQWMDVAKNQDGPTGTLPFWFWPSYFRFDEAQVSDEGVWKV